MWNRRKFIGGMFGLTAGAVLKGGNIFQWDDELSGLTKLTILHTNDQHSRIEPFPENDPRYGGQGGFSKRAAVIERIRQKEENVLLLDAGDVFQGTPYFNYFHGELEFKLMSKMGYEAITLGNHDFDLGVENLLQQIPHAGFDIICSNYDFKDTDLRTNEKIKSLKVIEKGPLKIGILGVGIDPEGLMLKKNIQGLKYLDPIENANKTAAYLKKEKKCDYVICLSHLGYSYKENKVSDMILAKNSENIDLIIGGHTHTFLKKPVEVLNKNGKSVLVNQVGWAGVWMGHLTIYFDSHRKIFFQNNLNFKIS